jgi:pyruvyltransferase
MSKSEKALPRLRALPFGGRLAESLVRAGDARNDGAAAGLVRALARLPSRPIPMYWWSATPNFGDAVSAYIVAAISNGTPVLVSRRCRQKVLAAGSILHRVADGDWVWGTGAISDEPIAMPSSVRICAVRGPLTYALLQRDAPQIYGDPVMLLPRYYRPTPKRHYDVGLIPHLSDRNRLNLRDPRISIIDVQSSWQTVVDGIAECDLVLSSSLHGLIVAEAYGIPAIWVSIGDGVKGAGFKFRDYYLATKREPPERVRWIDAIRRPNRHLSGPVDVDLEPLVGAWPAELVFRARTSATLDDRTARRT